MLHSRRLHYHWGSRLRWHIRERECDPAWALAWLAFVGSVSAEPVVWCGRSPICAVEEVHLAMAQAARAVQARLGPLVSRAQSSIEPAYNWTEKQAVSNYQRIMKDNQQYIVKDKASADKLWRQLLFTNLARWSARLTFSMKPLAISPRSKIAFGTSDSGLS